MIDFGLSRQLQQSVYYTNKAFGVIPYVDSKTFYKEIIDGERLYKLSKKADIYSLGVLFWELTSGKSPFNYETRTNSKLSKDILMFDIFNGKRETLVPNTNAKFVKLYQSKLKLSFCFIINIHSTLFV